MIILMGKTGSGKDMILKHLQKHGFHKIPTVTTRPPRFGEVDGVDYIFTDEKTFRECIDDNLFVEYRRYHVVNGDWWYGSLKSRYLTSSPKDAIILTPDGYTAIKNYLKTHNISHDVFLITADYNTRRERIKKRGDDDVEIIRRMESDEVDFSGLDTSEFTIIQNNGDISDAILQILRIVMEK